MSQNTMETIFSGGVDKYLIDLEAYEESLYCSSYGNDSKKTFNYQRTVSNGEVYWCNRCKTENLVSHKPNEDNY